MFGLHVAILTIAASVLSINTPVSAVNEKLALGSNKADCITKQVAINDLQKLKEYGNGRVDYRKNYLDKFYSDTKIDSKYGTLTSSFNKTKDSVNKKLKKDYTTDAPSNHKANLTADRDAILKALEEKKGIINDTSSDVAKVAEANCSIIWDLRVASYVAPKLKNQYALDALANKNAINKIYYKYAQEAGKTSGVTDPSSYDARVKDLQAKLDLITVSSTSTNTASFNTSGGKSADAFKSQLTDFDPLKKDIVTLGTKLKSVTRKAISDKKKEDRKQKKSNSPSTNNGGGSSGGSSSSGASGGPGSSGSSNGSGSRSGTKRKTPTLTQSDITNLCSSVASNLKSHCKSGAYYGLNDYKKGKITSLVCTRNGKTSEQEAACNTGRTNAINFLNGKYGQKELKREEPKRKTPKKPKIVTMSADEQVAICVGQLKASIAWQQRSCRDGTRLGLNDYNKGKKTAGACYKKGRAKNVQAWCDKGRTGALIYLDNKYGARGVN